MTSPKKGAHGGNMVSPVLETVTEQATELQIGYAGTSIPRKEDSRLVQGEGVFADDVKAHGMGYVHFVRSPYAHARIVSVDVSEAEALEGVYGTLTPDEVAAQTDPFFELTTPPGSEIKDFALAVGKVRHVGEPVVAVVARTRELARDAADLVEVEYEPLPVLVDARKAQDEGGPVLHDDAGTNVVWSGTFDWGDVDGALKAADRVIRIKELHFDRFSSTPLECSAALVEYDRGTQQFTIRSNHQMPGIAAIWMGPALRVPLDRLRFISQDIGGGFGNKITTHNYLTACCLLARKLRRPIQWTEWRTDQHSANAHGNERWFHDVEVAVMNDGTMLGFKVKALDDCGAFPRYEPLGCIIWAQVTPGLYRWRNIRVDFTQVVTNKSPVAPNRGYSRMQQLWLTERIVDIVAHELGLDPVEVRKQNYVRSRRDAVHDAERLRLRLGRLRPLPRHGARADRLRAGRKAGRGKQSGKLVGIGIGSTLDSGTNNFGQSTLLNPELQFSGNNEVATIRLDIFGEIVLTLGTVPQGQGHETTAASVVADILGCTPDDVHVRAGHDSYWNSHAGFSGPTRASSRSRASRRSRARPRSSHSRSGGWRRRCSGATPDDIVLENKMAALKGNPEAALPFMACGAIVNANNAVLPMDARDITLNCRHVYVPPFELPDKEKKYGNLDADVRDADPRLRRRDRPRHGRRRDRRLRRRGRLRRAHPSADRRGPGARRDRARPRRGAARDVRLRRGRPAADGQLLRVPRAACTGHAADQDRLH